VYSAFVDNKSSWKMTTHICQSLRYLEQPLIQFLDSHVSIKYFHVSQETTHTLRSASLIPGHFLSKYPLNASQVRPS
jgi:hypothetical protein